MLSLSRQFRPHRCLRQRATHARSGFTLIEVVIALAVLGTMAAGVYIGFNSINTYAVSTRLYSEAQTAAQNQIDLILSREPFDVKAAYISGSFDPVLNKVPIELMTTAEIDALAASGGHVSDRATFHGPGRYRHVLPILSLLSLRGRSTGLQAGFYLPGPGFWKGSCQRHTNDHDRRCKP